MKYRLGDKYNGDTLVGDKVIDFNSIIGTVESIEGVHNVYVLYGDKGDMGSGLYCLDPSCIEYDPLFQVGCEP